MIMSKVKESAMAMLENQFDTPEMQERRESIIAQISTPVADVGRKDDSEKSMVGLIPPRAALEEGYVWGMGAKKYSMHNWKKGLGILRICGAILRHTFAIMGGQDIDPESGRHHGAHIRCDAAMLIEFYYEGRTDLDDRFKNEKTTT